MTASAGTVPAPSRGRNGSSDLILRAAGGWGTSRRLSRRQCPQVLGRAALRPRVLHRGVPALDEERQIRGRDNAVAVDVGVHVAGRGDAVVPGGDERGDIRGREVLVAV